MTPFGIESIQPYLSSGPPPLSSSEYADAFNDVKQFGSFADTGSPAADERAAIGKHWQAEANTARETGLWLKAALTIVETQGTVNSLPDTARLFALIAMATADAVAVSWTNKFDYHSWRPADAIRATGANVDGNPSHNARIRRGSRERALAIWRHTRAHFGKRHLRRRRFEGSQGLLLPG